MWYDVQRLGADRAEANPDETVCGSGSEGGQDRLIFCETRREFEGAARGMMGIQSDVEVYLVADGRSIAWKETEGLGDGRVVEVVC